MGKWLSVAEWRLGLQPRLYRPTHGPQLLWGQRDTTIATLVNCLTLPVVTQNLASGSLIDPENLAGKYGIRPNNSSYDYPGTAEAYPVISSCLEAYCGLDGAICGSSPFGITMLEYSCLIIGENKASEGCIDKPVSTLTVRMNPAEMLRYFDTGVCHSVTTGLNADIGGVGVSWCLLSPHDTESSQ